MKTLYSKHASMQAEIEYVNKISTKMDTNRFSEEAHLGHIVLKQVMSLILDHVGFLSDYLTIWAIERCVKQEIDHEKEQ